MPGVCAEMPVRLTDPIFSHGDDGETSSNSPILLPLLVRARSIGPGAASSCRYVSESEVGLAMIDGAAETVSDTGTLSGLFPAPGEFT
jgi:hypothetical protein